jgi:hypothetical protein
MDRSSVNIILEKPYSNHPGDHYLSIVLAEVPGGRKKFVTWLSNNECGGFSEGHYHDVFPGDDPADVLANAVEDFKKRGVRA